MTQLKPCPFCGCERMSMYPLDEEGFMLYIDNAAEYGLKVPYGLKGIEADEWFCKETDELMLSDRVQIECDSCGAIIRASDAPLAIRKWNGRDAQ
jgi:hypothetical protein